MVRVHEVSNNLGVHLAVGLGEAGLHVLQTAQMESGVVCFGQVPSAVGHPGRLDDVADSRSAGLSVPVVPR